MNKRVLGILKCELIRSIYPNRAYVHVYTCMHIMHVSPELKLCIIVTVVDPGNSMLNIYYYNVDCFIIDSISIYIRVYKYYDLHTPACT